MTSVDKRGSRHTSKKPFVDSDLHVRGSLGSDAGRGLKPEGYFTIVLRTEIARQ